jgi:hypothetical protein
MAEESVRDTIRHVRAALQEKGPLGSFLLAELDASISRGMEEFPVSAVPGRKVPEQIIGRRPPTDDELLVILVGTLKTYLVTLPAVADSSLRYLSEHYGVKDVEITLDPSILGDEAPRTGHARIDAILPRLGEQGLSALRQLDEFVSQTEGSE